MLSERCEAVVAELKQVDQKYSKKISQMQEQHELVRDGAGGVRGADLEPRGAHLGPLPWALWSRLGEPQPLVFWGAGHSKFVSPPEVCPACVGGALPVWEAPSQSHQQVLSQGFCFPPRAGGLQAAAAPSCKGLGALGECVTGAVVGQRAVCGWGRRLPPCFSAAGLPG